MSGASTCCYEPAFRQVIGGLLVQDRDASNEDREEMQVVSERRPTEEEWSQLLFAWRVCKHVKSNAIVLARDGATIGLGAGQMSRVDSVRIAIEKAQSSGAGFGARLRRVLPVPRWARARARAGRDARSSSRAARSATRRWSRRSTAPARRWSSPTADTSGTSVARLESPGVRVSDDDRSSPALSISQPQGDSSISRLGGDPPSPYEGMFGFSRVVSAGQWVLIGGTTSVDPSGFVVGTTPYEQTVEILRKLMHELARVGLSADDVVQTRMYVTDISRSRRGRPRPRRGVRRRRPGRHDGRGVRR